MEDKVEENTQRSKKKNKKPKTIKNNENSLRNFWDDMKHNNVCIIGKPEGEERDQGTENLFAEILTENFPNLVKEKDIQVQEAESPKQDRPKEAHTITHHK